MESDLNEKLAESQNLGQPQAYCAYHPQNLVLNFCRNSNCLMPLCQDCIKLHQQEHYQNGTFAQFDTLEDVQREVNANLEDLKLKYLKHKGKYNDYSAKLQSYDVTLYEQLKVVRQKVNEIIDKFFSTLHQEIISKQYACKEKQEAKLNEHYKLINERQFEFEATLKKMQGEHFLKYLIEFLNSSAIVEENNFQKDSDATLSIFNMQLMDVMIDESKLHDLKSNLHSLVSINNASLYEGILPQQQSIPPITQQYPIQSVPQLPLTNLQASNAQTVLSQSMNFSNVNCRNASVSPTRIMHTQTPSANYIQPSFRQVITARSPVQRIQRYAPITSQKIFYPNTTMYSSIKYIQK